MAQPGPNEVTQSETEAENTFGLDEVIGALSRDLKKAQKDASKGDAYGLYLGSAEVELQFTVQRTTTKGAKGGVNFRVFGIGAGVDANASAGSSDETVHRITIQLIPKPAVQAPQPAAQAPQSAHYNLDWGTPLGVSGHAKADKHRSSSTKQ
jgi:hypothetical protein